jgi:hypothetical protein
MRIVYGTYRTRDRAAEVLEDMFASGDVLKGERPDVEPMRDHAGRIVAWLITVDA